MTTNAANEITQTIKIRAKMEGNVANVRVLITHEMETGLRKDNLGVLIPAHFIDKVILMHNGQVALEAQWGAGISKNPYLACFLENAKVGDKVTLIWTDNLGKTNRNDASVS
jgi:sulfur-oxidizing protein SoxZ